MSELTAEQFAQRIHDSRLMEMHKIDAVFSSIGGHGVPLQSFTDALLRQEMLTNWQVTRLMEGHLRGFFYGQWSVLYIIGHGTFARVYRAVHRETGEIKAVKVLRNRYSDDAGVRERFIREARTVMQLRHPNIVPIHEVEANRGRCYMVMDFVEGQNLRDYVRAHGKLPLGTSLNIIRDLASGLDYALRKGITHRDIKLSNVLLSSKGQARLVDFGLAAINVNDDDADEKQGPRSVDYAGLERVTNVKRNDPRSDMFFLGCALYQMLTGQPPLYETRERMKRLAPKRFREIPPITNHIDSLPHRVVILVNRLMDLNAEQRIQTPLQALAEVESVIKSVQAGENQAFDPELSKQRADEYEQMIARKEEGQNRSIMLVESNQKVQDLFRDKLKEIGYRLLIMSDPIRALQRFAERDAAEPLPADLVIFGCTGLGTEGLEAFNQFAKGTFTKQVPAILLLEDRQSSFQSAADVSDPHRVIIWLPAKFKEIRQTLRDLLTSQKTGLSPSR
jgi:serine/threonine protein kinase